MNKRHPLFLVSLFLLLCLLPTSLQAETEEMERIRGFMKNIHAYHQMYPQEKVYLHLDNNAYFPKEKIWFKAYVFKASTLMPTDMSKILYVELLTPDGAIWERKTLPIENGRTYGEFDLGGIFHSGFYEIRAYTRAMTNWDGAYAYSRVFPIFNPPKDSLNTQLLSIDNLDFDRLRYFIKRDPPRPLLTPNAQQEKQTIITFYPEGGHIIKGVKNRVAFKTTDQNGNDINYAFTIYDRNHNTICKASPLHNGMGIIELPDRFGGGYAEISDLKERPLKFNLPEPKERGIAMTVSDDEAGNKIITLTPNGSLQGELVGLSVTCRGRACHFDTLRIGQQPIVKKVSRGIMRDGIQQITLFTPEGEVLSERLTWVAPREKPLMMKVKQNEKDYLPFQPIVLDFELKDHLGNPLRGDFSVSVQDKDGIVAPNGPSLRTSMLLCSDLKGYIHKPEYYFESDDALHKQALDLLLMVQGWRRYEWKEMAQIDTLRVKQQAEERQIFDGRVIDRRYKYRPVESIDNQNGRLLDFSDRVKPMPGIDVNLMIIDEKAVREYTPDDYKAHYPVIAYARTRTDSLGRFAFSPTDTLYDDMLAYISATLPNKKGQDKKQNAIVQLNRVFYPQRRAYEPSEMKIEPPQFFKNEKQMQQFIDTFLWIDTLPKMRYLPPAKVTEIAPKRLFPRGSRWTWRGGENAAKQVAALYYNMEDEMEQYLDTTDFVPTVGEWLARVNPNFIYNKNYRDNMTYCGKRIMAIIDNGGRGGNVHWASSQSINPMYMNMADFRALYICSSTEAYQSITGNILNDPFLENDGFLFLFYSHIPYENQFIYDAVINPKKGERRTYLHGLSRVEEFYSPDYRRKDMPSDQDQRRTLYWNPSMTTDDKGKANVILFNNYRYNTEIKVDIQGIAVNGQMFETE